MMQLYVMSKLLIYISVYYYIVYYYIVVNNIFIFKSDFYSNPEVIILSWIFFMLYN